MNLPLSLSAQVPNNAWMKDISPDERSIRLDRAIAQFQELYRHTTRKALVYILPSHFGLQDQTYVSNLGVVLPHCDNDTVVVSRFRTKPRVAEAGVGADFFKLMNFVVERPPKTVDEEPVYFEGEADLKHIRGNIYIGGYGMRTSRNALTWAAERFEMNVIPFRITDPYLYHLDCCVFRLTDEAVLLCTSVADRACLREIEQHCEIIDVSLDEARSGITNNLLLAGEVLCDSNICELGSENPKYAIEKAKLNRLEEICSRLGRRLTVFCMSEFYKSGALLSCLVMHIKDTAMLDPVPSSFRHGAALE
jgi:N-dimethylarginine dimethylaminohydrolase